MKKKLSVVILICFLLSLLCGCTEKKIPEFLPGQHEGDENYVWVCKEPFACFFLIKQPETNSVDFKVYFENEDDISSFDSTYNFRSNNMQFGQLSFGEYNDFESYFSGSAEFQQDKFEVKVKFDDINFFGGELPTLRFEKMTKEEFHEIYGEERFYRIIAEGESDNQ